MSTPTKTINLNQTINREQSLIAVKNAIKISITTIAYLRNMFHETCFRDYKLPGVTTMMLEPRTGTSRQFLSLFEGISDALEKGYLKRVVFGLSEEPNTPDQVAPLFESYTYDISYKENRASLNISSLMDSTQISSMSTLKHVQDSMIQLVRSAIAMTRTLPPLPNVKYMGVSLFYNETCPKDYEPKNFFPSKQNMMFFDSAPDTHELGGISTPHHRLRFKLKTILKDPEVKIEESEQIEPSQGLEGIKNEQMSQMNQDTNMEMEEDDITVSQLKRELKEIIIQSWHNKTKLRLVDLENKFPSYSGADIQVVLESLKPEFEEYRTVKKNEASQRSLRREELWKKTLERLGEGTISAIKLAKILSINQDEAEEIITRLEREGIVEVNAGKKGKRINISKLEKTRKSLGIERIIPSTNTVSVSDDKEMPSQTQDDDPEIEHTPSTLTPISQKDLKRSTNEFFQLKPEYKAVKKRKLN